MEGYTLYVAKNIFQIRKSQLNAKLDKDLQNTAKNHTIKTKIFDDKNTNLNNWEEDIEKQEENNIDLPMADTYLYTVTITQMGWREQDANNCLESSVLSHLYHFFRILDKTTMITTCNIGYDLNLFYLDSRISQKLISVMRFQLLKLVCEKVSIKQHLSKNK